MYICNDCPRRCGVDRDKAAGFCGGKVKARVVKTVAPFLYEEPCLGELSAVFFGGCNLRCSYCQNFRISRAATGEECGDRELAELFDGLVGGADLVTPTHYISAIERALPHCKVRRPIVYNTSGYETEDGVRRAAAFTDVFLTDFKYVDENPARKYSAAPDYFLHASRAVALMRKLIADEWTQAGDKKILKRGLIVRHLVLPGCAADSIRVLDYIAAELGTDTVISLMSQFTPNGVGEPKGKLKRLEYKLVVEHALKLGFKNGYIQDFASANAAYTPEF